VRVALPGPAVSKKSTFLSATALLIMALILFDVDIDPEFSLPHDVVTLDSNQESRFKNCVDEKDRLIHAETFAAIDNPDVQREILITEKERAARVCRDTYPQRRVTVSEPMHFNVIDLTFRY